MEKYSKIEKIGEGTYGIVFKARNKITGEFVAIKRIKTDSDEGVPCTSIREASLLREMRHPNIVHFHDIILEGDKLFLILEYIQTDLKKFMDDRERRRLEPQMVKSFIYQLLQAIWFLHRCRIIHRDLKPQNLLVSNNGLIKVADFGLGRCHSIPIKMYTHEVVTLWYRAPEILLGTTRYTGAVDIWALGTILAELATGKPLFPGDSEIDQLFKMFRMLSTPTENTWPGISLLPDYTSSFPNWTVNHLRDHVNMEPAGLQLLDEMIQFAPQLRIAAVNAVKHRFFNNLDTSKLPKYVFDVWN